MLSIQCLSIALSVTLVLVTGGIIGGLSITMGNEATDKTKTTCNKGLAATSDVCRAGFAQLDNAANDGVNQSLSSGRENAEYLTQLLMTQTLGTITTQVTTFFDTIKYTTELSRRTFRGMDVAEWGDPTLWRETLRPMARALYYEGYLRGMTILSQQWDGPPVDGVISKEAAIFTVANGVKAPGKTGSTGHAIVGQIKFTCDGLNQAQCATAECVWCSKPGTAGYCGNPMRKDTAERPAPCRAGWSTPPGYTLKWYQTTAIPYGLGVCDRRGEMYVGSCGYDDPVCGCAAMADYRYKHGDDLDHPAPVGQYRRPDGTYPEPGTVPKSQLLEAGMCKLPESLSGLSIHRTVRDSVKFALNTQHWTPIYGGDVSPILAINCWFTTRVGDQKVETYAGVNLQRLSELMKSSDLPRESRTYLVQTDQWKAHGTCKDDFHNLVAQLTMNCALAGQVVKMMVPGVEVCDVDLNVLSPLIAKKNIVREHCPQMCGVCDGDKFPVEAYDGWLVGASHGTYFRALPIDESPFYNVSGELDIVGKRAIESEDNIVANHSRMVMGDLAGYANLQSDTQWIDGSGRLWWVKKQTISIGEVQTSSLQLTLVLLVLRDMAMEVIDNATEKTGREIAQRQAAARAWFAEREKETAEEIKKDNDETEREKEESFLIMILITAVSVIILLVISVVFVRLIIAPLLVLEHEMAEVAVMHLESVDRNRAQSRLAEVSAMQRSFLQMIANLIEYRNYMPQSVLCGDEEEDEEEENQSGAASVPASRDQTDPGMPGIQTSAGEVDFDTPAQGRRNSKDTMARAEQRAKASMEDGLRRKQVSFAVVTLRGWHQECVGKADDWVSKVHTDTLAAVLLVFQSHKGVPDVFSGDRVLCSFNGVKACRQHKVHAAKAALNGSHKAAEAAKDHNAQGLTSASCVAGDVQCGNSGCAGMKRYTFFGSSVTWVWALERLNSSLGTTMLADSGIVCEVKGVLQVRVIDKVLFPKRWKDPHPVSEFLGEMQVGEDEWMYQLEEGEKNNKYNAWAVFAQTVHENKFGEELEKLRAQVDKMEGEGALPVPPMVSARYRKAMEESKHSPIEILHH
eukprot:Hpha_TRINITY_DN14091_c0_g1::TRINITY_DN14091_c0_g1_i1::g.44345::m.44345